MLYDDYEAASRCGKDLYLILRRDDRQWGAKRPDGRGHIG